MWVKICANTNLEDALLAAKLGADAVGFVFAPSPRQVSPAQAAAIVAQLPANLETVGVFPDWSVDRIVEAVEQVSLTTIQLHGTADLELIRALRSHFTSRVTIIQVVHWKIEGRGNQAEQIARQVQSLAATPEIDRILIDAQAGVVLGGTGARLPWKEAQTLFASHPKLILAGGLNPNNVGEAIHQLNPWGVDVASGVEAIPGKKDGNKVRNFIQAARGTSPKAQN